MNLVILFLLAVIILVVIGITMLVLKKQMKAGSILLWIIGVFFIVAGVYLFPATMWRSISIGALCIGLVLVLIGTGISFIKQK